MPKASSQVTGRVVVEVSEDRLTAAVRLGNLQGSALTADEVLAALKAERVELTEAVQAEVASLVTRAAESPADPALAEPIVVAHGVAPVEGADEQFVWDESFEEQARSWQGDASVNYYSCSSIVTVEAGKVIGRLEPLVPATTGRDVHGAALMPKHEPKPIQLHETVSRSADDPRTIQAVVAGRVVCKGVKLRIEEQLTVPGDVDFSCGNIDSCTPVNIFGTINDRFEVCSSASIVVGKAIEGAHVRAGGDIVVRAGIVGRNIGSVRAEGMVVAKFANEADIRATGDIKIGKELINSRTHTEASIVAEHAAIIGGCAYARQGMTVGTLGSDAQVPTRLAVGVHPAVLLEAQRIEDGLKPTRDAIEKIRSAVQPLMANMRRLTPAQREQATELLFKAEEAEANVTEKEERRRVLLGANVDALQVKIEVLKAVYPGTVISIGERAAMFEKVLKGPVTLQLRKVKNYTEFVAVNQLTGSVSTLKSVQLPLEELVEGYEEREEAPAALAEGASGGAAQP